MSPARPIHVLSDEVVNKIAAGEVVDRPASVLKELMENALDAGATSIAVDLVAGGRKAIVVADDGCGMTRDDALLSVERHATSKIREVEDIEHVATLGFRGEALAAVAAVSRFTLTTRPAGQEAGTELTISGGRILDVQEAGCPVGTTFAVRNLFFNVPARRKFLRTEQTEMAHARQVFLVYALSHPQVALRLRVDDRELYRLTGGASLEDRIRELFGADLVASLRPIAFENDEVRLKGMAGLPQATRGDRSEQYIFVNGRPASAPVVNFAVGEAYQTLIPRGRHPVLFLFIEVAPELVDVNVHPTKKEIRFRHPTQVRDAVIQGIRAAVAMTPGPDGSAPVHSLMASARAAPAIAMPDLPSLPAFAYPRMAPPDESAVGTPAPQAAGPTGGEVAAGQGEARGEAPWSWCRILGQAGGLYVVLETEDGLILMDPHAAHERILYEKFMRDVAGRRVKSQGLLAPEAVDLPPERALCARKNLELLRAMGFGISEFGGDTFVVDALPVCLGNVSARSILVDVAESLDAGGARGGTERWAEDRVAQAACKAAVKARDKLTVQEIEQLVLDLARAEMPYTCPHGRPTIIFMGFHELGRKFGRE